MRNKDKIRKHSLEIRSKITEEKVREKSNKIQNACLRNLKDFNSVIIYLSYRKEVKTDQLVRQLVSSDKEILAPITEGKSMKAVKIESLEEVTRNEKGIREPVNNQAVEKSEIEACIVPGLSFDYSGNRIGYGGGYYDRFLENFRGQKIGLTYEDLLVKDLPTEDHDVPIDKVITENGVVK